MSLAAAPEALGPALSAKEPLDCRDAIVALAEVKGYTLAEVKLLVARLDDTERRSAGGLAFSLAESAARTLEATTGLKFGADQAKWSAWIEEREKALRSIMAWLEGCGPGIPCRLHATQAGAREHPARSRKMRQPPDSSS